MLGGLYLAFEGYEKVHHMVAGEPQGAKVAKVATKLAEGDKALEDEKVSGAIRTDFILSAEIMAIALATIEAPDLVTRAVVLAAVAVFITVAVYGVVALIVKADDIGVRLAQRNGAISGPIGRALVRGMPPFLETLSFIGMIAMLWVGGGILVHGLAEFGFATPEHIIHGLSEAVRPFPLGDILAWVATAGASALVGLVAGAVTAIVVTLVRAPFRKAKAEH
jgi:predicted DNA repair protein MutK